MGMLGHAIEVMIAQKEGEPLILDFWLDNEEYLELSKEGNLFDDVASTAALLQKIPMGFVHPFEGNKDIRAFLKVFDYMNQYAGFERKAKKIALNSIDSVVLMSVINHEYGHDRYTYDWIKYRLSPKNVTTGSGVCNDPSDVKNCLKAVAST